jgi:hypothetical protein
MSAWGRYSSLGVVTRLSSCRIQFRAKAILSLSITHIVAGEVRQASRPMRTGVSCTRSEADGSLQSSAEVKNMWSYTATSLWIMTGFCWLKHKQNKQTPWPESASELYRSSDLHLLATLVPTFADRRVPRQRDGSLRALSDFWTPWPESASEPYGQTVRRLSANLVPTFADRGCHVVGVTDPLRPYSRLPKPEPLLFLSSSSSVVLTRLSGPRSRPTTSQKMW